MVEIIYCNYETIQMRMYVVCTFNCGDFCVLRLQYVHEINLLVFVKKGNNLE